MSDERNQGIKRLFVELKKQHVRADDLIFAADGVVVDGIEVRENQGTVWLKLEVVLFYGVDSETEVE